MGVRGLWRLLLPIGHRISIETLAHKTLAIDASIWLTQFLKANRDPDTGAVRPAAHIIGFIRRICKLLFHRIRPVFVFDGPTPAIKLREVAARRERRERLAFGSMSPEEEGDDAAVKRMARRILVTELKKQKELDLRIKRTNNGEEKTKKLKIPLEFMQEESRTGGPRTVVGSAASFSGLNPDNSWNEHDEKSANNLSDLESRLDGVSRTLTDNKKETRDCKSKKCIMTDDSNDEAIHMMDLGEIDDFQQGASQQPNDWDAPPSTPVRSESGSSDESIQMPSGKDSQIDLDGLSSFPANLRKEIIEKAKRDQRMQSRREFMPVAANPVAYSQVQLKNFLKSSHLNKKITEIGTQLARGGSDTWNDEFEGGERIASDATRRIVFTKVTNRADENKVDFDETIGAVVAEKDAAQFPSVYPKRKRLRRMASIENSERTLQRHWTDDQENEEENDDNDDALFQVALNESLQGQAVAIDDSSSNLSDGSCDGGGFVSSSTPDPKAAATDSFKQDNRGLDDKRYNVPQTQRRLIHVASDDDDSEPSINDDVHVTSDTGTCNPISENANTHLLQDDFCENLTVKETNGEGGDTLYLGQDIVEVDEGGSAVELGRSTDGDSSDGGGGFLIFADKIDDSQYKKCNDSSKNESVVKRKGVVESSPVSVDHALQQNMGDELETTKEISGVELQPDKCLEAENNPDALNDTDDESGNSVDWEDGEEGFMESPDLFMANPTICNVLEEGVEFDGMNGNIDDTSTSSANKKDADGHQKVPLVHEDKSFISENVEGVESYSPNHDSVGNAMHDDYFKENDNRSVDNLDTNDFDRLKPKNVNSHALKQAQATAAKLTDWAGRAFQRAIAAHVLENGPVQTGSSSSDDDELSDHDTDEEEAESFNLRKDNTTIQSRKLDSPITDAQFPKQATPEPDFTNNSGNPLADDVTPYSSINVPPMDFMDTSLEALRNEEELMREERNRQSRDMDTVTEEMKEEIVQLLQLFGIPYVESPAEAEAQCAMLEELGLVDGIVTEDSDVFVFGGRHVYRNIFDDQKYVEAYLASDAMKSLALGRNEMVALAMILGGDYTDGIKGIGIVNGMEVLQAFSVSNDVKSGLTEFRNWLDGFDPAADVDGSLDDRDPSKRMEREFHRKHKSARTRWVPPQDFPAHNVLNAYIKPVVDTSQDKFSWGVPDLDKLRTFCSRKIGWSFDETDRAIVPVIKELENGSRQTRLESYFMRYDDKIKFAEVRSKRLREVFSSVAKEGARLDGVDPIHNDGSDAVKTDTKQGKSSNKKTTKALSRMKHSKRLKR